MTSYQKAIVSECNMSSSFWPWQFFQRELFPPKRHCVSWYCRHTKIHQKLRASLQKRKSLPFSTEVLRSSAAAFFCIVRRHNSLLVLLISQLVPLLREQSMERYISFLPWNVGLCRKLFFCTVEIYKVQCIGNWTDVLQYVIRFLFQIIILISRSVGCLNIGYILTCLKKLMLIIWQRLLQNWAF